MRILFVCSSLEPGRDGVGDYTRQLAQECMRLGHPSAMLALHDRHLTGAAPGSEGELRLAAGAAWDERIAQAASFAAQFEPDWVSLQFVGYGYQQKGVVWALPRRLQRIIGARPLHVMLHELWSGSRGSPKQRLVGWLQRYCVIRMLRMLRPAVIHTTLEIGLDALAAGGISAALLPLLGNIPIADMSDAQEITATVRDDGVLAGGFFGAFYPEWQPEPLFTTLLETAKTRGLKLRLVFAGRLGAQGELAWNDLTRAYTGKIDFVKLGEQPPRRLSQLFQLLDFGIPTAPWPLLGKSAAAAAMLDHGLPLLVSPDPRMGFRGSAVTAADDSLLHRCDEHLEAKLLAGLPRGVPQQTGTLVASRFLASLQAHQPS